MKKFLEHLRSLPVRQRKLIIISIVVFVGITALVTYPLWGSVKRGVSKPTIVSDIQNGISGVSNEVKTAQNATQEAENLSKTQQQNFETKLGDNEYFTNEEQSINDLAVNVRKVLLDKDRTIVWFRISNLTQNIIQINPESNFDITAAGVTYIAQPLNNETLTSKYKNEQGQTEVLTTETINPQTAVEGYIAFQAVPQKSETFTLHLRNVLNKETLKKWSYSFTFDTEKLQDEKSASK